MPDIYQNSQPASQPNRFVLLLWKFSILFHLSVHYKAHQHGLLFELIELCCAATFRKTTFRFVSLRDWKMLHHSHICTTTTGYCVCVSCTHCIHIAVHTNGNRLKWNWIVKLMRTDVWCLMDIIIKKMFS